MSLDGSYDPMNPFARILRGELPSAAVYENDSTLAFLDMFPQSTGHTLVISKRSQARNLLEIEPDALAEVMTTVKRVAIAARKALTPDGIHIAQFNGGDTGQSVFHFHVHMIPRWKHLPLAIMEYHGPAPQADPQALQALARRIAEFC